MIEWIANNKEWIFSGIGVAILSGLYAWLKSKRDIESTENKYITSQSNASQNCNNGTTIVAGDNSNVVISNSKGIDTAKIKESTMDKAGTLTIDGQRAQTHILFIDNEDFKIVSIIKKAGWRNCCQIKKVSDLNADKIQKAHIIFVDIKGVGEDLFGKDAGLGVAKSLKQKYPSKTIILYSAESNWNIFHEAISLVDERIEKNAKPIEFISLIETFADKIWKKGL